MMTFTDYELRMALSNQKCKQCYHTIEITTKSFEFLRRITGNILLIFFYFSVEIRLNRLNVLILTPLYEVKL